MKPSVLMKYLDISIFAEYFTIWKTQKKGGPLPNQNPRLLV